MRLPPSAAHFSQRTRCGNYVARRLRRARMVALAADVELVTDQVLTAGRAVEDADKPIQNALADRDASDDDLDEAAQTARLKLAARSIDAVDTAPYTLIFPQGVGYYTAAPLDEEVKRYKELKSRIEASLPAADKLRVKTVAAIDGGLVAFSKAVEELNAARTDEALAATRLSAANEAWERQMEKTYGAIVSQVGKGKAERFFPKSRGKGGGGSSGNPGAAPLDD